MPFFSNSCINIRGVQKTLMSKFNWLTSHSHSNYIYKATHKISGSKCMGRGCPKNSIFEKIDAKFPLSSHFKLRKRICFPFSLHPVQHILQTNSEHLILENQGFSYIGICVPPPPPVEICANIADWLIYCT